MFCDQHTAATQTTCCVARHPTATGLPALALTCLHRSGLLARHIRCSQSLPETNGTESPSTAGTQCHSVPKPTVPATDCTAVHPIAASVTQNRKYLECSWRSCREFTAVFGREDTIVSMVKS